MTTRSSTPLCPAAAARLSLAALLVLALAVAGCSGDDAAGGMTEDTAPPTVSLTSPVANAEVRGEAVLEVAATDDVGVAQVEYYVDGALAGTSTAPPWSFAWDTVPPGDGGATLQARAYDAAGNAGVSQTVPVTIKNGLVLVVTNSTPTAVSVAPSGQRAQTVAAGRSYTFTYASNPGTVSYRANTRGRHGLMLHWDERMTTAGTVEQRATIAVGSGYFFLRGRNRSSRTTSSMHVNYQAANAAEVDPFTLGGSMTDLGYFKGSGATRLRIYAKYKFGDLGRVYWDFAAGISGRAASFTLGDAAGKRAAGGGLDVRVEPDPPPPRPDGVLHYPTSHAPVGEEEPVLHEGAGISP